MREFNSLEEMGRKDFRALQMKVLDILIYFDEFCRNHHLRYYLAGGTLIGAVRNKGFIPWDEDVDIHMPRPDYDRLPALWKKYADTEKFTLCVTDKYKNFHHHAYGISDNETAFIDRRNINEDISQGILMDILPFDGCPKGKIREKTQLLWASVFAVYNVQRLPENQGGAWMKKGTQFALGLIKSPKLRYWLWKTAENQMKKYNFETAPYVKELVAPFHSMLIRYPREKFDEEFYVEFEGHLFPVQHYYKDYLQKVYGNYMELPPENKRKPKGNLVYINLDRSYREFKGIYYCTETKMEKKR